MLISPPPIFGWSAEVVAGFQVRKQRAIAKSVRLFGGLVLGIIAVTGPVRADALAEDAADPADQPRPTIPVIGYVYHAHDRALACYDSAFVRNMQSQLKGKDLASILNTISEKIDYGECIVIDKNNKVDVLNVSDSGDLTQVTIFNQIQQYWIGTDHIDLNTRNAP